MQGINVTNIGKTVIRFFDTIVEKIDKQVKFVKRTSKLTAKLFVEVLVMSSFLESDISLERLCLMLKQRGVKISKQGLHQRFNDESVLLMRTLFQASLVQFRTEKREVIALLSPFSEIRITDSTGVSLPSHLKSLYKGCGGKASESGLKLQATFDYVQGQIHELTITEGCQNDQSFDEHLHVMKKNALYLQDQGYFKLCSFLKIHEHQAYFISRYLYGTKVFDAHKHPISLLKTLQESGDTFEQMVWLGEKKTIQVRLMASRLSDAAYDKRIRKLKRSHQKRGKTPSQALLTLARWSIYITNIDASLLNHTQVHLVYSLRWQIELLFKLCKSEASIDNIKGRTIHRILCEIYSKLISVVKLLYFCFPIRWQGDHNEISFRKAYKVLRLRGSEFFHALRSPYRLLKFLESLFEDLIECAVKDHKRHKSRTTHQKIMDSTQQKVFV